MKTYKQILTELKSATLGRYIQKASRDKALFVNGREHGKFLGSGKSSPEGRNLQAKTNKTYLKRTRGIARATNKLVSRTKLGEEALNELKIKTMGNYVQKASDEKNDIEMEYGRRDWTPKNQQRKHANRSAGIRTAKDKIKDRLSKLKIVHKGTVH